MIYGLQYKAMNKGKRSYQSQDENSVRIIHRSESEDNPGTILIFDDRSGKHISPERLRYLQRTENVYVIDLVNRNNLFLFEN